MNAKSRLSEGGEEGYILIGVIFMVALVVLSLAIAAPRIAASIQRDRELELVHRGEQYKRAIRLYYKKFNSYPSSIDQLEKTNNIRYLRKRYTDPITGKDDWKLIHMGQAHVRPLGFFGQQLGVGSPIAGATSIGGNLGAGSSSGLGMGGSSINGSTGSSSFGQSGGSSFGSSTGMAGGTAASGGGLYAASTDDGSGTGNSTGGTSTSLGSGTSSSTTLGGSSTATGSNGLGASTSTTLGGAPVVGVMPPLTKETILRYKLKTNYKDWEFVYDPVEEQTAAGSILGGSGNINGTGNSVNGPGSSGTGGFNSGSGTPGFGSSNTSPGSSSSSGTNGAGPGTTSPQQ